MPSEYRKTRTSGLYVRHSRTCPAFADEGRRCRCEPSYRTRRRIDGKSRWSPVFKDRASAVSWDGHEAKAERAPRASRRAGPTFGEVARAWWALVEAGTYARRRGRSKKLSDTTIADYRGVLFGAGGTSKTDDERSLVLLDRCGRRQLGALDDAYWQAIVDELVRDGRSYSRIATYLAVIRHIYAYARRPNLRIVTSDPTRELQMPANDGQVRERVATAEEAAKLIEALPAVDSARLAQLGGRRRDPRLGPERGRPGAPLRRQRCARRQGPPRGALQDAGGAAFARDGGPRRLGPRVLHGDAARGDRTSAMAARVLGRRRDHGREV